MQDSQIIELYYSRNEDAIRQTDAAYGRRLHSLSRRILWNLEDAQECVNDTYLRAWETIPPQRPAKLLAYLAKICRNFSLDRLDWNKAAKRNAEVVALTEEMAACIPDHTRDMGSEEIGRVLDAFLQTVSEEARFFFLRRYLYLDSVDQIALRCRCSQGKVKMQLHRTREKLRTYLESEGITV